MGIKGNPLDIHGKIMGAYAYGTPDNKVIDFILENFKNPFKWFNFDPTGVHQKTNHFNDVFNLEKYGDSGTFNNTTLGSILYYINAFLNKNCASHSVKTS